MNKGINSNLSRRSFLVGAFGVAALASPICAFADEADVAAAGDRLPCGIKLEGDTAVLLIDVREREIDAVVRRGFTGKTVYEASTDSEPTQTGYDLGGRTISVVPAPADDALTATGASRAVIDALDARAAVADTFGYFDERDGVLYAGMGARIQDDTAVVNQETMPFDDPVNGSSYYNMMAFYAQVEQLAAMAERANPLALCNVAPGARIVPIAWLDDVRSAVRKIVGFDRSIALSYDHASPSLDVQATEGRARLRFHIAAGGWWGYALTGNSIIDKVLDAEGGMEQNIATQTENGNFFDIDYGNGIHIMRDCDIQSPYVIMDDAEALVIDVDNYGASTFHDALMGIAKNRKLHIYITHQHGDHLINLQHLKPGEVERVYYPKAEPTGGPTAGGVNIEDCLGAFDEAGKLALVDDADVIEVAGRTFEVVSMAGHTAGGTQLLDRTDRILFAGDTLGSQTFKGGTTIKLSEIPAWHGYVRENMKRHGVGTDACTFDSILTGHTAYKLGPEFMQWLLTCIDVVKEQGMDGTAAMANGRNLVSCYEGRVLTVDELTGYFNTGMDDTMWARTHSIAVTDDSLVAGNAREQEANIPLAFGVTAAATAAGIAGAAVYSKAHAKK